MRIPNNILKESNVLQIINFCIKDLHINVNYDEKNDEIFFSVEDTFFGETFWGLEILDNLKEMLIQRKEQDKQHETKLF
jgi:hypothetical protein